MKVIDNFLSDYNFKQLQSFITAQEFPWYYYKGSVYETDKDYQFTTSFFIGGKKTVLFPVIEPCVQQLGAGNLIRIKANLQIKTIFHRKQSYHVDYRNNPTVKTAILYINTNNGWTQFKKGGKVKSVENRIVIFDSNLEHRGVTCTDEDTRIVVNFNWHEK